MVSAGGLLRQGSVFKAPYAYIVSMRHRTQSPVAKPCPICGNPVEQQFRPFCSRRCADVDLHRWLSGAYAVPVAETDEVPEGERNESAEGDYRSSGR